MAGFYEPSGKAGSVFAAAAIRVVTCSFWFQGWQDFVSQRTVVKMSWSCVNPPTFNEAIKRGFPLTLGLEANET
jgi:hypothetical protein